MNHAIVRKPLAFLAVLNVLFMLGVLFHHHFAATSYLQTHLGNFHHLRTLLMYFSVGGFFFFAAYKLAKNKMAHSAATFWRNRLARIYPLYALAVLLFFFLMEQGSPPAAW